MARRGCRDAAMAVLVWRTHRRAGPYALRDDGRSFVWIGVLVGWAFFSRVPRTERWGALALMIVSVVVTPRIPGMIHPSFAGGLPGMMFWLFVVPGLCLAMVVWAGLSRSLATGTRLAALVAAILLACGFWSFVRTDGVVGVGRAQLAWRWKQTAEGQLLAR